MFVCLIMTVSNASRTVYKRSATHESVVDLGSDIGVTVASGEAHKWL